MRKKEMKEEKPECQQIFAEPDWNFVIQDYSLKKNKILRKKI